MMKHKLGLLGFLLCLFVGANSAVAENEGGSDKSDHCSGKNCVITPQPFNGGQAGELIGYSGKDKIAKAGGGSTAGNGVTASPISSDGLKGYIQVDDLRNAFAEAPIVGDDTVAFTVFNTNTETAKIQNFYEGFAKAMGLETLYDIVQISPGVAFTAMVIESAANAGTTLGELHYENASLACAIELSMSTEVKKRIVLAEVPGGRIYCEKNIPISGYIAAGQTPHATKIKSNPESTGQTYVFYFEKIPSVPTFNDYTAENP